MTTISKTTGAHLSIQTTTEIIARLAAQAVKEGKDINTYANEVLQAQAAKSEEDGE